CFLSVDPRNGCADRSNLKNCSQWQCSDDQIKCADSYCVDGQLKCNGKIECPMLSDWADEDNCPFSCSSDNRCPCIDTTINCTDVGLLEIPFNIESEILRMILKGNQLGKNLKPKMFVGFERMHTIDLSENQITYLPPGLFKNLWKLRILHLKNNMIERLDPHTFSGLPNLGTVYEY
ncbi:unnamed protein product, partial [Oppiella nova]